MSRRIGCCTYHLLHFLPHHRGLGKWFAVLWFEAMRRLDAA
jgi:hypothetical protein